MFEFFSAPHNLDKRTTITIDDKTFVVEADDLEKISDLGKLQMVLLMVRSCNIELMILFSFLFRTWSVWNS